MEDSAISILYIDDDQGTSRLVQKNLRRLGYQVHLAHSCSEGKYLHREGEYELTLLDYHLPDGDGISLLQDLKGENPQLPAVVLTGAGDEKTAVAAMLAGASNYVIKDTSGGYLSVLPTVIESALNQKRLGVQKERHQKALSKAKEEAEQALEKKDALLLALTKELSLSLEHLDRSIEEGLLKGISKGNNHVRLSLQENLAVTRFVKQTVADNQNLDRIYKGDLPIKEEVIDLYDAVSMVQKLVRRLAEEAQVTISRSGERNSCWVYGDRFRFCRVVLNILMGAVSICEKGAIQIAVRGDRGYGSVDVRIEGIGLPSQEMHHLCETVSGAQVQLSKVDGAAFPLVLAKQLCALQSGDLELTISDASGARIAVRLPQAPEPEQKVRDPDVEQESGSATTPEKGTAPISVPGRSVRLD